MKQCFTFNFILFLLTANSASAMHLIVNKRKYTAEDFTYNLGYQESWTREVNPLQKAWNYRKLRKRIQQLVAQGADINSPSIDGKRSALGIATSWSDLRLCEILFECGADVNCNDTEETALTSALFNAFSLKKKVVRWLLDHGADVNVRGTENRSPLEIAIADDRDQTSKYVSMLLKAGADPLRTDKDGINSLMYAAILVPVNTFDHPSFLMLEYIMRQKYTLNAQCRSFLCSVNRLRRSKLRNERTLGSVLFLNRSVILLHFQESVPTIEDILSRRDKRNKRAYHHCALSNGETPFLLLLYPKNSLIIEQKLVNKIRAEDAAAREGVVRQRSGCVMQ